MANRLVIPFQVLHTIMYGEHDWIERELPMVVMPIQSLCVKLRIRPVQLQEALHWLHVEGIISTYEWNRYYFTAQLVPPIGMRMNISKEIRYE